MENEYMLFDSQNNLIGVYDKIDIELAISNITINQEIHVTTTITKDKYKYCPVYICPTKTYIYLWFKNGHVDLPEWITQPDTVNDLKSKLNTYHQYMNTVTDAETELKTKIYKTAKNFGHIDSIDQFKQRFPSEKVDDFIFKNFDTNRLWNIYGDSLWTDTGYKLRYYGDHDPEKFRMFNDWPDGLLVFKRKVQLEDHEKIEDDQLFPTDMLSENRFFTDEMWRPTALDVDLS
jgi:hypothetical protein